MSDEKKSVHVDDAWRMDATAFDPKPTGIVKLLNDVEYPVYSFMDIPSGKSISVLAAADRLNELAVDVRMLESKQIVLALNAGPEGCKTPKIPETELDKLTLRQIITLTQMALTISQVPLKAGADASKESVSSGAVSAVSTGGNTSV